MITPGGIVLKEIHPEFTVEQVQAATESNSDRCPGFKKDVLNDESVLKEITMEDGWWIPLAPNRKL